MKIYDFTWHELGGEPEVVVTESEEESVETEV